MSKFSGGEKNDLDDPVARLRIALKGRLTQGELATLQSIKHVLNKRLIWGKVIETLIQVASSFLSPLIGLASGDDAPKWIRKSPNLFPNEREFLQESNTRKGLRREYLTLIFLAKLLTLARTKVRQRIEEIRPLAAEVEEALLDAALEERSQRSIPWNEGREDGGWEEEEGNLALARRTKKRTGCGHHKTTSIYFTNAEGANCVETSCKSCHTVLSLRFTSCKCKHVIWVPGEEGKKAKCFNTACGKIMPDPSIYQWGNVGLEPFGDDPTKDTSVLFTLDTLGAEDAPASSGS